MAKKAEVGIAVFPGTNCDHDAMHVFSKVLGRKAVFHWHQEPLQAHMYDLLVLPGGFSYGDYLRAGAMASFSPVVKNLARFVDEGGYVLGICNGFQILVETQLLPGVLTRNQDNKFHCQDVHLRVEQVDNVFLNAFAEKQVIKMPIAHADGRYYADEASLQSLQKNRQIVLTYCNASGEQAPEANINGSQNFIAGLISENGRVMGLMPHPERCAEMALGNVDGLGLFRSLEKLWKSSSQA